MNKTEQANDLFHAASAAVMQGDVARLKRLIAAGANVNATNERGEGLLYAALRVDSPACIPTLAAAGCDLNKAVNNHSILERLISESKPLDTPLHTALRRSAIHPGAPKVARALIEAGARTDIPNAEGLTARGLAGKTNQLALLLDSQVQRKQVEADGAQNVELQPSESIKPRVQQEALENLDKEEVRHEIPPLRREDSNYYLPNQSEPCIQDAGSRLTVKGNDQAIQAAVELAKRKGWDSVSITGKNPEIVAKTYIAARAAGLDCDGYTPTPEVVAKLADQGIPLNEFEERIRAGEQESKDEAISLTQGEDRTLDRAHELSTFIRDMEAKNGCACTPVKPGLEYEGRVLGVAPDARSFAISDGRGGFSVHNCLPLKAPQLGGIYNVKETGAVYPRLTDTQQARSQSQGVKR